MDSTFISFYTTLMCPNLVLNPRKTQEKKLLLWGRKHIQAFIKECPIIQKY